MGEIYIDVSALPPCEPLDRALEAIEKIGKGEYIRMLHRREPMLLYPILEEQGFAYLTIANHGNEDITVLIWKMDDSIAEAGARSFSVKRPS
ncbi:MAG: DUF2249 domain-containing protein [Gammaproteobacteria bacterium]|nr:DUF2249 domain-containing protein [Gammaproteobacteria bacterium]